MLQILKKPAKSFLYPVMFPKWKLRENEYNSRLATSGKKNKNWPCYISDIEIPGKKLTTNYICSVKISWKGSLFLFWMGMLPPGEQDSDWHLLEDFTYLKQLVSAAEFDPHPSSRRVWILPKPGLDWNGKILTSQPRNPDGQFRLLHNSGRIFFQVDALERSICVTRQEIASFSRPATFALLQNDH